MTRGGRGIFRGGTTNAREKSPDALVYARPAIQVSALRHDRVARDLEADVAVRHPGVVAVPSRWRPFFTF